MNITLESKLGKTKAKIFALCNLNISNMTALFIGVAFAERFISMGIEQAIWGESFPHLIDTVFLISWSAMYLHYTNELGKFLLDLTLNTEVK